MIVRLVCSNPMDDSLTLPALAIGANGVVSVSAHVYGLEMKEMIQAYLKGEHSEAGTLHRYLLIE